MNEREKQLNHIDFVEAVSFCLSHAGSLKRDTSGPLLGEWIYGEIWRLAGHGPTDENLGLLQSDVKLLSFRWKSNA